MVVTWPTGRVGAFDFTPEPTSIFLPLASSAAYTARPGTVSTLEPVAGDGSVTLLEDSLYTSLSFDQL